MSDANQDTMPARTRNELIRILDGLDDDGLTLLGVSLMRHREDVADIILILLMDRRP